MRSRLAVLWLLLLGQLAAVTVAALPAAAAEPADTTASGDPTADATLPVSSWKPLAVGEEAVAVRDAFTRTLATAEDDVYESHVFTAPIHGRQAEGGWEPIDATFDATAVSSVWESAGLGFVAKVGTGLRTATGGLVQLNLDGGVTVGFDAPASVESALSTDGTAVSLGAVTTETTLVVTARRNGVKSELVLASNQAPDTFVFPLVMQGATATVEEPGIVAYRDAAGDVVAITPPGWMYDASEDVSLGGGAATDAVAYRIVERDGKPALEVKLDRAWLDDPARVFPVVVDPSYQVAPYFYEDTYVKETSPDVDYRSATLLGTGLYGTYTNYEAYLQFGSGKWVPMSGRHTVSAASIRVYNEYSKVCEPKHFYIKRLIDPYYYNSTVTWNNKPRFDAEEFGHVYDYGGSTCSTGSKFFTFDVATLAQRYEDGLHPNYGVTLIGSTDQADSYKRFASQESSYGQPYASVTYTNWAPYIPSASYPTSGAILTGSPSYLRAWVSDPEGDGLTHSFVLERWDGAKWVGHWRGDGITSAPGASYAYAYPPALSEGIYRWTADAHDGLDGAPFFSWASFTVDLTAPAPPQVWSSTHPNSSVWYTTRDASMGWSASDLSGIDGYSWSVTSSAATPDTTVDGAATSTTLASLADGRHWFNIRARDRAGRWSDPAHYELRIDATLPPAPTITSSTHHDPTNPSAPPSTWSNDPNVVFHLSASDTSGIAGYSYAYTDSSTTSVDASADTSSSTVAVTSDSGQRWLHARAVNGAGLASGTTSRYRVLIDTVAPTVPGGLDSSHSTVTPSADDTVEMTWTPGTDTHSGVAGYSWVFSSDPVAAPDATADGAATTTSVTSPPLGDGIWWFHVRTIDAAGNGSDDVVYGPITVAGALASVDSPGLADSLAAQSDQLGLEQFFAIWQLPRMGEDLVGFANLRTGNTVVKLHDTTIPGHGLNVGLGYTYNTFAANSADDGLGAGWRLSLVDHAGGISIAASSPLEVRDVTSLVDGTLTTLGTVADLTDGDGTTHRFLRDPADPGRWISPPGVDLLATAEYGSRAGELPIRMRFTRPDGVVYIAEPIAGQWRTTRVENRNGDALNLSHELVGEVPVLRLTAITHSRSGFNYYSSSSTTASVQLAYGTDGVLDRVVSLPGVTASDGNGGAVVYERTTTFAIDMATGLLDRIITRDGTPSARTTDIAYGAGRRAYRFTDGRGNATFLQLTDVALTSDVALGQLIGVADRDGREWRLSYPERDADGYAVRTQVRTPERSASEFHISARQPTAVGSLQVAGGNIERILDRSGASDTTPADGIYATTAFTWEANRLRAVTDAEQATTTYTYDSLGQVVSITEPAPNVSRATLPADAPTTTVTSRLTHRYLGDNGTAGCAAGTQPAETCATHAELAELETGIVGTATGRITTYAYDASGRPTTVTRRGDATDPDRVTTLSYHGPDGAGPLATIDGPRTDVTDVTTYGDASQTDFGYHRTGQPERIVDAAGTPETFAYSPYGPTLAHTDRDGNRSRSEADVRDRTAAVVDTEGRRTSFRHDGNGNLAVTETNAGHVAIVTYDPMDRPTVTDRPGVTDSDRITTSTTYDHDGRVNTVTNELGGITSMQYWPNGWLRRQSVPAGTIGGDAVTDHTYDKTGRVERTTHPAATDTGTRPVTVTTYSAAGTVASSTDTSYTGAVDRTTRFAYDAHGATIQTLGPRIVGGVTAETTTGYNVFGETRTASRLNDGGRWLTSRYGYDRAGNLAESTQPSSNPADATVTYTYDLLDRLTGRTDPANAGHTVAYGYTPAGRQNLRQDLVDGTAVRTMTVTYNPSGSVRQQTATDAASGQTLTVCAYLTTPADGYDTDGQLRHARTLQATTGCTGGTLVRQLEYGYDAGGRLASYTQKVRAPDTGTLISRTQTYTHHRDGSWASVDHAGATTSYAVTAAGWMRQTTDWRGTASTIDRLPSGAVATMSLGLRSGTDYDATGTFARHPDGSVATLLWQRGSAGRVRQHFDIRYDIAGLRASEHVEMVTATGVTVPSSPSSRLASFGYDLAGRLTGWTSPLDYKATEPVAPVTEYVVDDGGNLAVTRTIVDGITRSETVATLATDRLDSQLRTLHDAANTPQGTITTSLGYDRLGGESSRTVADTTPANADGTRTTTTGAYEYVTRIEQTGTDAGTVDYLYDPDETLLTRRQTGGNDPGVEVYFTYGPGGPIAEVTDGSGTTQRRYLVTPDGRSLAEQQTDSSWHWLLVDPDGNVATQLRSDRTVIAQAPYSPYGAPGPDGGDDPTATLGTVTALLGFQGDHTDRLTGTSLLGPRQYDPSISRFTTTDTYTAAGLDAGLSLDPLTGNRYLFAGGNPVLYDDDGHDYDIGYYEVQYINALSRNRHAIAPHVFSARDLVSTWKQSRDLAIRSGYLEHSLDQLSLKLDRVAYNRRHSGRICDWGLRDDGTCRRSPWDAGVCPVAGFVGYEALLDAGNSMREGEYRQGLEEAAGLVPSSAVGLGAKVYQRWQPSRVAKVAGKIVSWPAGLAATAVDVGTC